MARSRARYAYHNPRGNPCTCGIDQDRHRVAHAPKGEPCAKCGLDETAHYRKPDSAYAYHVGVDGEGQGRADHKYVLLSWSDEEGKRGGYVQAASGFALTTVQCFDLLLSIPSAARPFGFALGYDLTKILTDVDNSTIYRLLRPELRRRAEGLEHLGPKPESWNGYQLNYQGSKFSLKRGSRKIVLWDIFKFYQAKFTSALRDWLKSEPDFQRTILPAIKHMETMKEKRSEFDRESPDDVRRYCELECRYMALLARKLDEAHEAAGLDLRSYHGAGSTASAILKKIGIGEAVRTGPPEIDTPIASAFFGGRFENSCIGSIAGPLYGADISGAYVYQLPQMPCLACGRWERVTRRRDLIGATTAVVRYGLGDASSMMAWGPFPFRLANGSIAFPSTSGGGWVWLSEYLAAERAFDHIQFREAWTYRTSCGHKPFAEIPKYYLERLRIGKEGPGIVIKLGTNACYGKLAQSLGTKPPFQSWIWSGMITAGTRAQLLDAIALHRDRSNVLMVATDGYYSREDIDLPKPIDTGTLDSHNKPLGGWERKLVPKGMFAARPGIYFPLNPTEDEIKEVRARGVGRTSMLKNWREAIDAYERGNEDVRISEVSRFHGAKSTIHRGRDPKSNDVVYYRSERYGQWTSRPVDMSFDPLPKRAYERADRTLAIRSFPQTLESTPYNKSLLSVEAASLKRANEELDEQPDGGDYSDIE